MSSTPSFLSLVALRTLTALTLRSDVLFTNQQEVPLTWITEHGPSYQR